MDLKGLVVEFYERIWNQKDLQAIGLLMSPSVRFRGSLGNEARGHKAFQEYVIDVLSALKPYRCLIADMLAEENRVFARMTFEGRHVGHFQGYMPTNAWLKWSGCALFSFENQRITELWVLGDLYALHQQLRQNQAKVKESQ